ncbi:complement C3-like [Amphiprion ocellaris]|uniref:complement C3-like n=1 Tax=Amphiprion ocellaris TaxID=80972 RepID=UPI002410CA8C|nr:complement C3-like [Amphiprion ocellaris]
MDTSRSKSGPNPVHFPLESVSPSGSSVFRITDVELGLPAGGRKLTAFSTLLARRLILLKWKDAAPPTPSINNAVQCPGSTRRRRSAELLKRKAQLGECPLIMICLAKNKRDEHFSHLTESHYKEKLQHRCCKDGLREIPMPYSCTRRSLYITEGWECIRAFRYCCATYRDQVFDTEIPTTPPTTTAAPTTSSQPWTVSHTSRREKITLSRYNFGNYCTSALSTVLASKNVDTILPDSITEWGVLAVSSSPQTGSCVAEPYNVRAWKGFFVDLKLPHSVARNQQVEIKAVVHNYGYDDLHYRERQPRVVTYYNQLHEVEEKMPCKHFDLNVTFEGSSEKPPADVEKSDEITIKVSRALGPRDIRMVVLDISLPTGFTPENSDLEMLSNSVHRYISNFQIVDNLSDRGSLIIHLFKVTSLYLELLFYIISFYVIHMLFFFSKKQVSQCSVNKSL